MSGLKNKEYATAFFVGAVIALIGFAAAGVYPFGNYAAVCSDMEQQFLDLTAGIFNNLKSGKNIFVTYSGGMGINLFAWSAYILYDPLNILFLFFDVEYYQEVYLVIDIIKYGFIALCASVYFKKSNYTALSGKLNIALAVLYAFGSFCLKSMINVMWLGNVAMLPIVMLAIERVIEKKKAGLLFVSFLYCMTTNFYLAFVTGLFSLIYFVFYYINTAKRKDGKDILKSVAVCGVTVALVGGLCMAFIVPAWTNISGGYDEMFEGDFLKRIIEWKPVYIAMFLTLIQPSAAVDNVIHGFFGVVPLFLAVVFFLNKNIAKKEKICALVWVLIMLLSLMIRPLYLVWHVFREPTGFYGRFVYAAAFLFIMLSARSLGRLELKNAKLLAVPVLIVFLLCFYAVSGNTNYAVLVNLLIVMALLLAYMLLFAAYIKNRAGSAAAIAAVIICEALVMSVYGLNVSKKYDNWAERSVYYDDVKKIDRLLKNIDDDSFYRITNVNRRSLNAAFTSGYNATEVFSSFTNQRSLKGLAMLGLYSPYDYRSVDGFFNNTVTDSLLADKYAVVTHKDEIYEDSLGRKIPAFLGSYTGAFRLTSPVYKKIADTDDGIIYENTAAFPLMFRCSEKAEDADTRYINRADSLLGGYKSEEVLLNSLFDENEKIYTECRPELKDTINAEVIPVEDDEDFIILRPTNLPEGQLYANEGDEVGVAVYEYKPDKDTELCMDIREYYMDSDGTAMRYHTNINGFNVMTYHMPNCQFETSDIGWFKKGESMLMCIETQRVLELTKPVFAELDTKVLEKFAKKANENALKEIKSDGSDITAVSDFDKDSLVFMSLSYDEGFHIYIDGTETEKVRIADSFLGCRIPAGVHEIRVKYVSPGFKTGMVIFAGSALLSCVWLVLNGKNVKREGIDNEE